MSKRLSEFILLINCMLMNNFVETCKTGCITQTYRPYLERTKFLAKLANSRKVGDLALIGTHSSLSYNAPIEVMKTQELTLEQQLKYGIRVLDISLRPTSIFFEIFGLFNKNLGMYFHDLLRQLFYFLDKNPSELLILIMHRADEGKIDASFNNCEVIDYHIENIFGGQLLTKNWTLDDPIEYHRGKILMASYDESFRKCAFEIQKKCLTNIDAVFSFWPDSIDNALSKWTAVKYMIAFTNSRSRECYVNDISFDDLENSRRVIAKDGGYEFNGVCVHPINQIMANNFKNPHSVFIIVLADYVTQELMDAVNDSNFPN